MGEADKKKKKNIFRDLYEWLEVTGTFWLVWGLYGLLMFTDFFK